MICRDIINYKILVVITPLKIKQTKNTELWVWCLLTHSSAHWLTLCGASVCCTVNTQITNFSISGTTTSKIIYFLLFLNSTSKFFLTVNGTFLGAPFQDRTTFFFTTLVLFFGCVLEETHGSRKWRAECREQTFNQGYCNWVVRNLKLMKK